MPTSDVYLTTQYGYSKNYDQLQGTSMASPQVAGLAALLIAQYSNLTNAEVRSKIESSTDDLGASGFDNDYGNGRVNVCKAFEGTNCDGPVNETPIVDISTPLNDETFDSGVSIPFAGSASDTEDINLSADDLAWTSSRDGSIGSGGSFSAVLSDGDHTITASVTDSYGKVGRARP